MKKRKKRNILLISFLLILILCLLFYFPKKQQNFQGKIYYQRIDSNFFVRQNKEITYDTEDIYDIKDSTIKIFHRQNPAYSKIRDIFERQFSKKIPSLDNPKIKLPMQISIAGNEITYNLKTKTTKRTMLYDNSVTEDTYEPELPTDCLIRKIKGDTIILGYRCQKYILTKPDGIQQEMWIAPEIKANLPPDYSTINPGIKDTNNNVWLSLNQGVCLLLRSRCSEKDIFGARIPFVIKATKIEAYN